MERPKPQTIADLQAMYPADRFRIVVTPSYDASRDFIAILAAQVSGNVDVIGYEFDAGPVALILPLTLLNTKQPSRPPSRWHQEYFSMRSQDAIERALAEFNKASAANRPFNSPHEGFAVLKEEVDELWDLVKGDANKRELAAEAKQVAAMALRFLADLC